MIPKRLKINLQSKIKTADFLPELLKIKRRISKRRVCRNRKRSRLRDFPNQRLLKNSNRSASGDLRRMQASSVRFRIDYMSISKSVGCIRRSLDEMSTAF